MKPPKRIAAIRELSREVEIPQAVAAALMTGRAELVQLQRKPLTPEETAALLKFVQVLIETNAGLRNHAQEVAQKVVDLTNAIRGLRTQVNKVAAFAKFEDEVIDDEEDD